MSSLSCDQKDMKICKDGRKGFPDRGHSKGKRLLNEDDGDMFVEEGEPVGLEHNSWGRADGCEPDYAGLCSP